MKRPEPDTPAAQARAQAAADWLVKRDRGLTAEEQDEFLHWLAADPRHGDWFALHRHTTGDFTCLAQWLPEHSDEPNPDLLAPARRRPRIYAFVTLAAATSVAMLFVWQYAGTDQNETLATTRLASSGYAKQSLSDGSVIELNHGSSIDVQFTADERRVALSQGEALFTVAKNPDRPFIVNVRGVDVRAVGTAFNIRVADEMVEVFVTEGRVRVASSGGSSNDETASLVEAGHRAVVSLSEKTAPLQIVAVSQAEAVRLLAWQPQLLDFSSVPLEQVIAEFNRRNSVELVLADRSLAPLPIVAAIRSDNVEGLLRFLEANAGVRVERKSADRIELRRK